MHTELFPRPLIAVVEDDWYTLELIRDLLLDEGYQVLCCLNAQEAYREIKHELPRLIILDVHLEGSEDGLAVLETLRGVSPSDVTPFLICSADAQLLRRCADYFQHYGCEILEKPFDINTLIQKVTALIGSPTQSQKRANIPQRSVARVIRTTKRLPRDKPLAITASKQAPAVLAPARGTPSPGGGGAVFTASGTQTYEMGSVFHTTQQLCSQAQLLIEQSRALRANMTHLIEQLNFTERQCDHMAWLQAMSGPKPRWLWRVHLNRY